MNPTFLLSNETKLEHAIEALDKYGTGFLAFIDEDGKLKGVLTDGDLRRAILRKEESLDGIINKHPVTMPYDAPKKDVIVKLKSLHRRHMPLVDQDNILRSVFSLDEVDFACKENKIVIMAGGLGTRLGELTRETPKPMLKVGDRPILQHLIELFRDQGFNHFYICVNYKKEVIQTYFGDGSQLGVKIEYVVEESRLGTAGALGFVRNVMSAPFFVINADVLTNLDFDEVLQNHINSGGLATMCVRQFELQVPYGVVRCDGEMRIASIEEKPAITFDVSTGIYILDPKALDFVEPNTYLDMPSLFNSLVTKGFQCLAYRLHDYWVDIGRVEDLTKASIDISTYSKAN